MGAVAGKSLRFFSRSFSQFTLSPLSRSLEQASLDVTVTHECLIDVFDGKSP